MSLICQYVQGDNCSFRTVFSQIQSSFLSPDEFRDLDSFSASFPLPYPPCTDDMDAPTCLECIFKMAKENTTEAQLEASRILCDLSMDINLQQVMVDKGVLGILRELILHSFCEWCQQHAIVAVSNLSDAKIFQVGFDILHIILQISVLTLPFT
jgi:hypothetical protein